MAGNFARMLRERGNGLTWAVASCRLINSRGGSRVSFGAGNTSSRPLNIDLEYRRVVRGIGINFTRGNINTDYVFKRDIWLI